MKHAVSLHSQHGSFVGTVTIAADPNDGTARPVILADGRVFAWSDQGYQFREALGGLV